MTRSGLLKRGKEGGANRPRKQRRKEKRGVHHARAKKRGVTIFFPIKALNHLVEKSSWNVEGVVWGEKESIFVQKKKIHAKPL